MHIDKLTWFCVSSSVLSGKGWLDGMGTFNRLPDYCRSLLPEDVWNLSRHSTGINLRFKTNSSRIHAKWTLGIDSLSLPHMPATSVSGLDLYARDFPDQWRWAGIGRPEKFPDNEICLNYGFPKIEREYLLYLPLHNEVTHLEIGIESQADFQFNLPSTNQKPIVYYGTSIVHGIAASRAGMCHASIIDRSIENPVINLGFSGRAKMEIALAQVISDIDPALYILDCLPNMPPDLVDRRVIPFMDLLRHEKPNAPILLLEDRTYANAWTVKTLDKRNLNSREILFSHFELLSQRYENLHYLNGDNLLGEDSEGTVDGSHPNDLGFYRIAKILIPCIRNILENMKTLDEENSAIEF
jgi:hypothetical protein